MLCFSANLSFLFIEKPFMERFTAARGAGFKAVEFMFPYEYLADQIKEKLLENDLKLVLFNLPAGNWAAGERGIALKPQRKDEFHSGVQEAAKIADKLAVKRVNCLVGRADPHVEEERSWEVLVKNIRFAADTFKELGVDLMVEAVNHEDVPGFYLNKTGQVWKLIDDAGRSNVYLQYDIYHGEREQEDHLQTLRSKLSMIGHIQIADNPGRHQPGTGNINYHEILRELDQLDYKGYVGLEYNPVPDTLTSLRWLQEHGYNLETDGSRGEPV